VGILRPGPPGWQGHAAGGGSAQVGAPRSMIRLAARARSGGG
jgi:hypothetical protein